MSIPAFTRWSAVEGYCAPLSFAPGEAVPVHCSSRVDRFAVTVTLVGAERTVVWSRDDLTAAEQPFPEDAWRTGCGWPATFTITTDPSWPSGFYEVRFDAVGGEAGDPRSVGEAFFVLRPPVDGPRKPSLLILSTNTYNAYNQWGGRCLYTGAEALSFERPIERGYLRRPAAPFEVDFDGRIANVDTPSDPEHLRLQAYQHEHDWPLLTASAGWHNWERRFVRWAQLAGFEFDVAINSDLDVHPEVLDGHRLVLSVGHDEYWSWGMRDAMDDFVERGPAGGGGNWVILSGNTAFWQVRYEDDGRTMVCHKGSARRNDPVRGGPDQHLLTSMWSDPLIGRPENSTTGLSFTRGGYHRVGHGVPLGAGAYTVHRPDHWAFADTGVCYGDQLGAGSFVVGYEVDGCAFDTVNRRPVPTGEDGTPTDLEILGTCPARLHSITDDRCEAPAAIWASVDPPGDLEGVSMVLFGDAEPENVARVAHGHAVMASFRRGAGTVFNGGSADWAYGLDRDPLVQQVTANVIRHLGGV
ncbi:MAG: N,N-dimethylformamidase beta subunit family domain-containing protein [Actinomycetota bacterium]